MPQSRDSPSPTGRVKRSQPQPAASGRQVRTGFRQSIPVKHIGQLRRGDRDRAVGRRRPDETAALQPLGVQRHADPVVPENLDQMTAFAAKDVQDRRRADRAPAPPGPAPPGCSCRAACRCDRPPATPARRTEPGSSPRQRLDDRRRQFRRDRARYPNPDLAPTSTSIAGSAPRRRTLRLRQLSAGAISTWRESRRYGAQFLPPAINLARRNIGPPRHLGNHRPRRKTLGDNRPFLILAPAPPTLGAGNHLKSRHRTVACTAASTVICTGATTLPNRPIAQGGPQRRVTSSGTRPSGFSSGCGPSTGMPAATRW